MAGLFGGEKPGGFGARSFCCLAALFHLLAGVFIHQIHTCDHCAGGEEAAACLISAAHPEEVSSAAFCPACAYLNSAQSASVLDGPSLQVLLVFVPPKINAAPAEAAVCNEVSAEDHPIRAPPAVL